MKVLKTILNSVFTILIFCIATAKKDTRPNFIIILTDDQGYNDLGCFGSPNIRTPNIDHMVTEGDKLTSFYIGAPYCILSKTAPMTGCYPKRIGMAKGVFFCDACLG